MSQKKSTRTPLGRSNAKRNNKKQRPSLLSRFRNSKKAKLILVAVVFGVIGTYFVVDSYADGTIGIHIAPRATNLSSQTYGPRVVTDSTASKRNVKAVYVATKTDGSANQVSVTQALKKGTYEVCTVGRPHANTATGKLRVSDKPYGTSSALTVEQSFKSTSPTEYIKLACPMITLPNDTTVYISHVVTKGAYNFTIDAVTPVQQNSGSVPCALTSEAKACWAANTGPINPNGGRYTKAQIIAGQSNLKKVTSQATAPAGTTYDNGKLTVNTAGAVLDRIWLEGCIAVNANNVTISNSLINNVNHKTCSGGNRASLASTINNGGCVGEDGDGPGAITGMVIKDTEVDANDASFDTSAISNGNYRMNRVNFHGANVGAWASCNAVIEESFGHGLTNGLPPGIHEDVIDADTSNNVTVNHSWLSAVNTSGAVTGAMVFNKTWGTAHDGTVTNSFLQGGNGADARFAPDQYNMVVKNNAFSNVNGYGGTVFLYGWNPDQPGNVWSGNYVPETGKKLNYDGTQY